MSAPESECLNQDERTRLSVLVLLLVALGYFAARVPSC